MKTAEIIARIEALQNKAEQAKAAYRFWKQNDSYFVKFYDRENGNKAYFNIEIIKFLPEELRDEIERVAFERWKAYDNLIKRIEQGDYSILNCVSL